MSDLRVADAAPPPKRRVAAADASGAGAQQLLVLFGRKAKVNSLRVLVPSDGGEQSAEGVAGSWRLLFAPGTAELSAKQHQQAGTKSRYQ